MTEGEVELGESTWNWLLAKQFEERSTNIRTAWDIYIKFYVAFLALNVAGIGAVVQYVEIKSRGPIVYARFRCIIFWQSERHGLPGDSRNSSMQRWRKLLN